ncbi:hypothetical protein ACWC2T_04655 [Streptomyces sp. NPDC001393]
MSRASRGGPGYLDVPIACCARAPGPGSAARAGPAFAATIRAVAAITAAATALRAVVFP